MGVFLLVKHKLFIFSFLLTLSLFLTSDALPKLWQEFDQNTIQIFVGTVDEVQKKPHPKGRGNFIHIQLKVDDGETLEIKVAPEFFLQTVEFQLQEGDHLRIKGFVTKKEEAKKITAIEIVTDTGDKLLLRNEHGVPVWLGRGWHKVSKGVNDPAEITPDEG